MLPKWPVVRQHLRRVLPTSYVWVVLESRVLFRVGSIRVPTILNWGDLQGDPNLENYPYQVAWGRYRM